MSAASRSAGEGSSAVLESRAPAPRPECVAEKDGLPRAGIGGALGGVGRGVQLGPGIPQGTPPR